MCGIFCEICTSENLTLNANKELLVSLKNRGPNSFKMLNFEISDSQTACFCGAVLWMQGNEVTSQPLEDNCSVILFNGDIFDASWDKHVADTLLIFRKLQNVCEVTKQIHILNVIKSFKGPFSLIYYDKIEKLLYFTRDRIGRCSLLFYKNNESIIISSVLGRKFKGVVEVPACHIYVLNVQTLLLTCHTWSDKEKKDYDLTHWFKELQLAQSLPDENVICNINADFHLEDELVSYIENAATLYKCEINFAQHLLDNVIISDIVTHLIELLEKSVQVRVETQPNKCTSCININTICEHCNVGILFSGGLDCTILAYLAEKFIEKDKSIDLINVAFNKGTIDSYDVPDRLTGRKSFEELSKLCPLRKWAFIEVNVSKDELQYHQKNEIADLVYPRQTILDESLGSALWFAARGKDDITTSTCRVLLLGSGADELFGGYIRHRNAFKRHGWVGLQRELLLDWRRISFRNLARDNRVICDHGRQPRMPYLDEDFADFVLQLKPWQRCFPSTSLGPGLGDKLILRLLAFKIGLKGAAFLPKRALQFGSKIANKKEKGCNISSNLYVN